MARKIICPYHIEDTPSCNLYVDHFHCYGCGAHGPLEDLTGVKLPPKEELEPEEPEDLEAAYRYIDALPRKQIRGLKFPADNRAYYVTWPCKGYYKRRPFNPGKGPKYLGAKGHKRPLLWARREGHPTLALVEGEINALSIAQAITSMDVCSPGGVGDFSERNIKQKMLTLVSKYNNVIVIADADRVGAEAIINTLAVLWANGVRAVGIPMESDANEILVKCGIAGLKAEIEKRMGRALEKGSGGK